MEALRVAQVTDEQQRAGSERRRRDRRAGLRHLPISPLAEAGGEAREHERARREPAQEEVGGNLPLPDRRLEHWHVVIGRRGLLLAGVGRALSRRGLPGRAALQRRASADPGAVAHRRPPWAKKTAESAVRATPASRLKP